MSIPSSTRSEFRNVTHTRNGEQRKHPLLLCTHRMTARRWWKNDQLLSKLPIHWEEKERFRSIILLYEKKKISLDLIDLRWFESKRKLTKIILKQFAHPLFMPKCRIKTLLPIIDEVFVLRVCFIDKGSSSRAILFEFLAFDAVKATRWIPRTGTTNRQIKSKPSYVDDFDLLVEVRVRTCSMKI